MIARRHNAMRFADQQKVKELENQMQRIGSEVDSLLLVSADMNALPSVFDTKFQEVQRTILDLRSRYECVSLEDSISGLAITQQPHQLASGMGIVTAHATSKVSKPQKRIRPTLR